MICLLLLKFEVLGFILFMYKLLLMDYSKGIYKYCIYLKMIVLLRGFWRLKLKIRDVDWNMKFISIYGLKVNIEILLLCFNLLWLI